MEPPVHNPHCRKSAVEAMQLTPEQLGTTKRAPASGTSSQSSTGKGNTGDDWHGPGAATLAHYTHAHAPQNHTWNDLRTRIHMTCRNAHTPQSISIITQGGSGTDSKQQITLGRKQNTEDKWRRKANLELQSNRSHPNMNMLKCAMTLVPARQRQPLLQQLHLQQGGVKPEPREWLSDS